MAISRTERHTTEIILQTTVNAPIEKCFDLARDIDFHLESARATQEQVIGGVTTGLISAGQEVEWKARHLGLWWKMRVRITAFSPPHYFQDRMVRGPFRSFAHDHVFEPQGSGTLMTDTVKFNSPVPILGPLFDRLILDKYLRRFLQLRNIELKAKAEARVWHSS